jgi:hypothetical protein
MSAGYPAVDETSQGAYAAEQQQQQQQQHLQRQQQVYGCAAQQFDM